MSLEEKEAMLHEERYIPEGCRGGTMTQREKAIEDAEAAGREIVYGEPTVLQLDLDSPEALQFAVDKIRHFWDHIGVGGARVVPSKSPQHYHVYVQLRDPMDRMARIFWQAALGSDRVREALNWLWAEDGNPAECFLVEVPGVQPTEIYRTGEVGRKYSIAELRASGDPFGPEIADFLEQHGLTGVEFA